ncbi:MAG: hypothetical protein ACAH80_17845 [Alphaproteobacteria bacterium]
MAILDLDTLFLIAESAPALDVAEAGLRGAGKTGIADRLLKLQQDTGLEIDHEMTGAFDNPPPGPDSAALRAAYAPVTLQRLSVVAEAQAALPAGADRDALAVLAAKLPAAPTATAAGPKP